MKGNLRLFVSLLCTVSFIFILRDSDTSPGGFLKQQVKRLLDDDTYVNKFCSGINLNTSITSLDVKESNSVRTALSKLRHGNPLITFINGPDSKSKFKNDYVIPALAFGAPWIVFFVISLLACVILLTNWCCMYCSCCRCCKCCQQPKNRNNVRGFVFSSLFFGIATIAVAIAGIVVSRGVATGGQATLCAGITLVAKLIEGDNSQHWVGVAPLAQKLYTVLNTYDTVMNELRVAFPLNNNPLSLLGGSSLTAGAFSTNYTASGADAQYTTAVTTLNNLYNQYKSSVVSRSDPNYSSQNYVPDYIANIGPDTNATANTGVIEAELLDKRTRVKTAATNTDQSMSTLFLAQLAFRNGLASGEQTAYNTSISVQKLYNKVGTFGSDAQTGFNAIGGGLLGLFILEGVLAIFAFLSICLVSRGAKSFNKGIHISWCLISLLTLLTWILATVSFPASLVMFEVCDAANLFINNATFFNNTFDKFLPAEVTQSSSPSVTGSLSSLSVVGSAASSVDASDSDDKDASTNKTITKARKILYNCLFAEQDMLQILNLTGTLGYFNNLMEPAYTITDLTGSVSSNSVQIPIQETEVPQYKAGTLVDGSAVTVDLTTLNSYTNKNTQSCTNVQDTWVLNSALCTSAMGAVFQSSNSDTYNVGNPTCIGFDVWTSSNSISNRYTASNYPSSCSVVGTNSMLNYVQSFVNNFVNNRATVAGLFGNIKPYLDNVNSTNNNFVSDILAATASYPTLHNITSDWYTAISDPNVGVYYNAKCTFVRSSVQTVHDTLCTAFVVNLFQSSAAIIVISFMAMLSFIMLFCLAKRFIVPEPGVKKDQAKYSY